MSDRHQHRRNRSGNRRRGRPRGQRAGGLALRRTSDGRSWTFVHPRCARERAEDLEEVRQMVEAGEYEIAADELRWLLSDCSEFLDAHNLLGELSLAVRNDVSLARGHFGCGYQLGLQTLHRANMPKPLEYRLPANQPFFVAGRGLAWCLATLDKPDMAHEVVQTLVALDPDDPLRLVAMLDELRTGGMPIVELLGDFPQPPQNRAAGDN